MTVGYRIPYFYLQAQRYLSNSGGSHQLRVIQFFVVSCQLRRNLAVRILRPERLVMWPLCRLTSVLMVNPLHRQLHLRFSLI